MPVFPATFPAGSERGLQNLYELWLESRGKRGPILKSESPGSVPKRGDCGICAPESFDHPGVASARPSFVWDIATDAIVWSITQRASSPTSRQHRFEAAPSFRNDRAAALGPDRRARFIHLPEVEATGHPTVSNMACGHRRRSPCSGSRRPAAGSPAPMASRRAPRHRPHQQRTPRPRRALVRLVAQRSADRELNRPISSRHWPRPSRKPCASALPAPSC